MAEDDYDITPIDQNGINYNRKGDGHPKKVQMETLNTMNIRSKVSRIKGHIPQVGYSQPICQVYPSTRVEPAPSI